jgi:hypothetical protein
MDKGNRCKAGQRSGTWAAFFGQRQQELEGKFRDLASALLQEPEIEQALEILNHLETLRSVDILINRLTSNAGGVRRYRSYSWT